MQVLPCVQHCPRLREHHSLPTDLRARNHDVTADLLGISANQKISSSAPLLPADAPRPLFPPTPQLPTLPSVLNNSQDRPFFPLP